MHQPPINPRWLFFYENPESATRVEFELRRETLKHCGVDSVEDYFSKRAELIRYLTHDWLRFTKDKVDRENKNQSKSTTLKLWRDVQDSFAEWAGSPTDQKLEPLPKGKTDVSQLFKQMFGLGITAGKYQDINFSSLEELLEYITEGVALVGRGKANVFHGAP